MNKLEDLRILLVNDEQNLIEYLSQRLLQVGLAVRLAFCGEEAVQSATQEDFDVALVDMELPGIGGLETQKRLKRIQPYLQCIALTDEESDDSMHMETKDCVYKFLLKPIDFETLIQSLQEIPHPQKVPGTYPDPKNKITNKCTDETPKFKKLLCKLKKIYGVPRDQI